MDEKRISKEEFDEAVKTVMEEMVKDPDIDGMAKIMLPLSGTLFASKMSNILFKESEDK
jgi:hypothetical protein